MAVFGYLAALRHRLRRLGKRRVHFLHVGKTGGTSIRSALEPVATAGPFCIELHRHRTTMRGVPVGEQFFFATRDPISRFVSGFYSRQRQGQPRLKRPWTDGEARAFQRFSTANELAEGIFEDEAADEAMRQIGHVNRSYWYWFRDEESFLARKSDVFFIVRQPTLTADLAVLAAKLHLADRVILPTDVVSTHRNPDHVDRHLSDKAKANLTSWYARDFGFLDLCERIRNE